MKIVRHSRFGRGFFLKLFIGIILLSLIYSVGIFSFSLYKLNLLSFSHTLEFEKMDKYSAYLQGVVGLFLNLLTIILVYRTFKQQDDFIMQQIEQSTVANKSEVFCPDMEIFILDRVKDSLWISFFKDREVTINSITAKLLNIGKSNCKNLRIRWDWDLEKAFEYINDKGVGFIMPHKRGYTIAVEGYMAGKPSDSEYYKNESVDYLLTYENMAQGRDIRFPEEYLELFVFYWRKRMFDENDSFDGFKLGSSECFAPLTMKIEYEDSLNKFNCDIYDINCIIKNGYSMGSEQPSPLNIKFVKRNIL